MKLTVKNYTVEIDQEDLTLVSKYEWRIKDEQGNLRAYTYLNSQFVYMHHLILPNKTGFMVDHKDRNSLNNKRSNLRYATNSQNQANRGKPKVKKATSKYKGVFWVKSNNKWRAIIRVDYVKIHLGYFTCEQEAAKAYDEAAKRYFKNFAHTNFN